MRKYTVYRHPDMGYCAMLHVVGQGVSQQVSKWYISLANLNRYWGKRHGIYFDTRLSEVYY